MRSCFIVNPNAGGGRGLRLWNKARSYMNRRGMEYEIYFTDEKGDARRMAYEITDSDSDLPTVIFVIGADSTLSETLNGLKHPDRIELVYIPVNVKYGFSRSLRLRSNPRAVIKGCLSVNGNRIDTVDYGVLTAENGEITRRFINTAGIGFDAELCHGIRNSYSDKMSSPTGIRGSLIVYRELLRALVRTKPVKGYILLDDSHRIEFNNLMFVSAHIHPYEYKFKLGSYADPKDGMLEICAISCRSRIKLLELIIRSRLGKLKNSAKVRLLQCEEAHIHFDRPCAVHSDGESLGTFSDIDLRCVTRQLHIIR